MALGGSGVVNASRNLVYGSAGAARYLVAGSRTELTWAAVGLGNPDSNRDSFWLKYAAPAHTPTVGEETPSR